MAISWHKGSCTSECFEDSEKSRLSPFPGPCTSFGLVRRMLQNL